MKNRKFILTALFASLILLGAYAQKSVAFREGKLKIVQLTDIHWDPQSKNCAQTPDGQGHRGGPGARETRYRHADGRYCH